MPNSRARRLLLAALLLLTASALHAQTAFLDPNFYAAQEGNYGTLGTSFTINPGYSLRVTHVGYWDAGSNGVTGGVPLSVALFSNATQQIIAGTQIDFAGQDGNVIVSDPNLGSNVYRFAALPTPIILTAGAYTIAEWNYGLGNGSDVFGNWNSGNSPDTFGGAVTFNATTAAADFATNGAFPTAFNSFRADFFAGNFIAEVVPEPATLLLFAAGAASLLLRRPRR